MAVLPLPKPIKEAISGLRKAIETISGSNASDELSIKASIKPNDPGFVLEIKFTYEQTFKLWVQVIRKTPIDINDSDMCIDAINRRVSMNDKQITDAINIVERENKEKISATVEACQSTAPLQPIIPAQVNLEGSEPTQQQYAQSASASFFPQPQPLPGSFCLSQQQPTQLQYGQAAKPITFFPPPQQQNCQPEEMLNKIIQVLSISNEATINQTEKGWKFSFQSFNHAAKIAQWLFDKGIHSKTNPGEKKAIQEDEQKKYKIVLTPTDMGCLLDYIKEVGKALEGFGKNPNNTKKQSFLDYSTSDKIEAIQHLLTGGAKLTGKDVKVLNELNKLKNILKNIHINIPYNKTFTS